MQQIKHLSQQRKEVTQLITSSYSRKILLLFQSMIISLKCPTATATEIVRSFLQENVKRFLHEKFNIILI